MINNQGFTLIELLIVIALVSSLALFSIPATINYYNTQITKSTSDEVFSALKKAQAYSAYKRGDSAYGIVFNPGSADEYVIFSNSYSEGAVTNEVFNLQSITVEFNPTISSSTIMFAEGTGLPDPATTTVITLTKNGVTQDISICESGLIEIGSDCDSI